MRTFTALPGTDQDEYWHNLTQALSGLVLPSPATRQAATRLTRLVRRNQSRPPGAKAIGSVSAPFAVGKSTFVKDWAHHDYRKTLETTDPRTRPTWNPEPGTTADWIPQVYITLRAASKIRDLNAAILLFLGYPSEGAVRVTTTRVVHALRQHRVELLVLDDCHFLDVGNKDGREVLDALKHLNTELGEIGGTMLLVGADLHDNAIYHDPQISSRLHRITLGPYAFTTDTDKRDWQQFLREAEQTLLPYFDCTPEWTLAENLAGHIWRRTQGYVGDTCVLLTEAILEAFDDASTTITTDHLDHVALSLRATTEEISLRTPTRPPSRRRTTQPASR